MLKFRYKLVAVLNKSIETGKLMNALAHMSLGLGTVIEKNSLQQQDYTDADGGLHPLISAMPFMILAANSNKISKLRSEALDNGILFTDFTESMTVDSYKEQLERMKQIKEPDLVYFGITLYGEWDKVSELTRKFSLWR